MALESSVEANETYEGGLEMNKHASKGLHAGRSTVSKVAIAGTTNRATGKTVADVVDYTGTVTLQGFATDNATSSLEAYTDEMLTFKGMPKEHKTVNHSMDKWIDGMARTNGLESFWDSLRRAYHGMYHRMRPKVLDRYVKQFADRSNVRNLETANQMAHLVAALTRQVGSTLEWYAVFRESQASNNTIMSKRANPESHARNPETSQTDTKSIARKIGAIVNTPSPNPRYGDRTQRELTRMLLRPNQRSK